MSKEEPIIRASEVAQFVFCARAWWLGRVMGYRSLNIAAMHQGTARHRVHGRAVVSYHLLQRLAMVMLSLAMLALAAWLLLSLGR